jgi:hypothetical protein
MRQSGFRAWKVLSGLAAVALLGVGCGRLPETGAYEQPGSPKTFFATKPRDVQQGQVHVSPHRGYNGTIQQIGSSIDPRTPERDGMRDNSRMVDVTGRPAPSTELGIGGSGRVGEPNSSSDLGWRSRRGYNLGPGAEYGPAGPGVME